MTAAPRSGGASADEWTGRDTVFVSYAREDARWMQALTPLLDDHDRIAVTGTVTMLRFVTP